ncbi:uncharacterized protein LOC118448396 [Vespa mandarinia]|uniref:uncharacterized protein LOC118448396 n=1 Tax=Vespa mandarinia TaxID=7446 RepID=UPI001620145A|nr:uncharacterized protein LOC118448396 [Vespa mandarinia]
MLDRNLNYGEHKIRAAYKVAKLVASLGTLMANVNGLRLCRRGLLMRAAEAVMLYCAEVWAEALQKEVCRKRIAAVRRRGAHRIACSYRTVYEPAMLVVAGVILIDLLVQERLSVHQQSCVLGKEEASMLARSTCIDTWHNRWEQEHLGRWTARLISRLDSWLNREVGEVDFYLTQFLTRHGLFCSYLAKMRKVTDGNCPYGDSTVDDALHTFFKCVRWSVERLALEQDLGKISPDNIVEKMLQSQEEWNKLARYIRTTLRRKKMEMGGT